MGAVPLPRFSLWLLGCFELTGPGDVVDLPGKKTAALLAYLASKSERQGRSDVTLRQSRLRAIKHESQIIPMRAPHHPGNARS